MGHGYSSGEFLVGIIGVLLTLAFGAWAAVVKKAADSMQSSVNAATGELRQLREEIHRDRLLSEKRFARLEAKVGITHHDD